MLRCPLCLQDHLDRPYKVLRHTVGSSSAEDPVVYEEKDEVGGAFGFCSLRSVAYVSKPTCSDAERISKS
jgi:protease II